MIPLCPGTDRPLQRHALKVDRKEKVLLVNCKCRQVWDVFEVAPEDREEDECKFALYATVRIGGEDDAGGYPFPVEPGQDFYEYDRCPTCGVWMEEVLEKAGLELV